MTSLVVTGSRHWTDRAVVEDALRRLPVGRLAHGGARGLDTIAAEVATELGWEVVAYPADWSQGKRAGSERNVRMVDAERPDIVLAFPLPQSRGTWHCARYAHQHECAPRVFVYGRRWVPFGEVRP